MQWGHRELWAKGTTPVTAGWWPQAPRSPPAQLWCAASIGGGFPMREVGTGSTQDPWPHTPWEFPFVPG